MGNQIQNLRMNQKFKKTPAGEIPVDWGIDRLSKVCVLNPSKMEISEVDGETEVAFISMAGIKENAGGIISVETRQLKEVSRGYTYFSEGDVLFAKITPCMENGKIALVREMGHPFGFGSTEFHVLRANQYLLAPEFLFYWVSQNSFRELARRNFSGSAGQQRVQSGFFDTAYIPLPKIDEQKRITGVLAAIDDLMGKVSSEIEKSKVLKQGMMRQLLTQGLAHKEYKKTTIGSIPSSWKMVEIKDVATVKGGKRLPKGHDFVDYKSDHPYVRVTDFVNEKIDASALRYISEETHALIKRYTISAKDVYISIAGTIGLVGVIPEELDGANLTENAAKLFNLRGIDRDFLVNVLRSSNVKLQIDSLVGKGTQPKLALFRIEKIKIPLPPIEEQREIVSILRGVNYLWERKIAFRNNLLTLKKGLMDMVLTGKVRVGM